MLQLKNSNATCSVIFKHCTWFLYWYLSFGVAFFKTAFDVGEAELEKAFLHAFLIALLWPYVLNSSLEISKNVTFLCSIMARDMVYSC